MLHGGPCVRGRARHALHGLASVLVAIAAATSAAGCGGASVDRGSTGPNREWTAANGDLSNTRRVEGPIDSASVGRLREAWRHPVRAGFTATALMVGDVVYTQDMSSNVYALEARTGRLVWRHDYGRVTNGPNGLALGDGRVYGVTADGAFALDRHTGRELWRRRLIRQPYEGVDMAPGYHDGTLFVSTVPAAGGDIGTLWALDGATGRRRWTWEQVPRSFWGHPEVNGGGGIWHTPAFDGRGGVYVDVANPVPWPGLPQAPWGSSRPGPNRWTNSLVKLDEQTGKVLWGRQVLPHDIYDWDLECPPILARAAGRNVVIAAGKMGFVYAFDADSGERLWKRSVGIHNGHDDDNLTAMAGDLTLLSVEQRIYPGSWGGVQSQLASDGRTVYVPVNNLYAIYHAQELPEQQDLMKGTGELVALDIASGRVKWDRKLRHSVYGGASISSNVVFTTTYEGSVWGLSTKTGAVLWKAQMPAGADAPIEIAGDTLITGAGIRLRPRQPLTLMAYRLRPEARAARRP